jgi:hypothetical protein
VILLLSFSPFLLLSLSLSLCLAHKACLMCVFMKIPLGRLEYLKARGSNAKKVVVLVLVVRRTRRENVARCCGEVFYSFRRDISYFKNNNTVVVVRASTVGSSKLSLSFSYSLGSTTVNSSSPNGGAFFE